MIRTLISLQKRTPRMKMCHMDVISLAFMPGSSSRQDCNKYYICGKSDCGCWICNDCIYVTKRGTIMDILNGD